MYSAAMQSGSQLLSGSHRGSYVTKGLGMSWGMVLQQRQCNDINMGSSEWRNREIRELLTFMAEELKQSHLTKTRKTVGSTRKYQRNFPYKVFVGIKDRCSAK